MTSSDENPAGPTSQSDEESRGADDGAAEQDSSFRSKKKTVIGLGKLRKSLKNSSPTPATNASKATAKAGRTRKKTVQGLPKPKSAPADSSTDTTTPPDPTKRRPPDKTDSVGKQADGSDESQLDHKDPGRPRDDDDDGGETDDPFSAPATQISASALDVEAAAAESAHSDLGDKSDLGDQDEPFEAPATQISASPLDVEPAAGESTQGARPDKSERADKSKLGDQDAPFEAPATQISESPLATRPPGDADASGKGATRITAPPQPAPASTPQPRPSQAPPPSQDRQRPTDASQTPEAVEPAGAEGSNSGQTPARTDDFRDDKTDIFDSPYESEALVPQLSALSGPASGQDFLLNNARNTIGRGQINTVVVADLAMSRQHLEITKDHGQMFLLVDLQSANGTLLNDTRVAEAELRHGDRIEAGKTEFQFVIPGNNAPNRSGRRHIVRKESPSDPAERTGQHRIDDDQAAGESADMLLTWVIIGAGVLSLFLLVAAGYLLMHKPDQPAPASATPTAATGQLTDAERLYLKGVDKVKARQWKPARALFEQVTKIAPDFAGVHAQLERVRREQQNRQIVADAKTRLANAKSEKAAQMAAKISEQSTYYDDAQQIIRTARQRRVASLYQKAQQATTDENFDQAQAYIAAIIEEVPNHRGALDLQKTIDDLPADPPAAPKSSSRPRPTDRADDWLTGKSAPRRRSHKSRVTATRINFTKGFALYKSAKFGRAADYFRHAASGSAGSLARRAQKTATAIENVQAALGRADQALGAGQWQTALATLDEARRSDQRVAHRGYFGAKINAKSAQAHVKLGLGAADQQAYKRAAHHYAKANSYDPDNPKLPALRQKLSNRARALYIRAANKRKTDPASAAKLCRKIVAITPTNHTMNRKARDMLSEL